MIYVAKNKDADQLRGKGYSGKLICAFAFPYAKAGFLTTHIISIKRRK